MKEPGKKNTDTGLEGIVDRYPELTIPLKLVKFQIKFVIKNDQRENLHIEATSFLEKQCMYTTIIETQEVILTCIKKIRQCVGHVSYT